MGSTLFAAVPLEYIKFTPVLAVLTDCRRTQPSGDDQVFNFVCLFLVQQCQSKIQVPWDVSLCCWAVGSHIQRDRTAFIFKGQAVQDGGTTFLRSVGSLSPNNTVSYPEDLNLHEYRCENLARRNLSNIYKPIN